MFKSSLLSVCSEKLFLNITFLSFLQYSVLISLNVSHSNVNVHSTPGASISSIFKISYNGGFVPFPLKWFTKHYIQLLLSQKSCSNTDIGTRQC